MFAPQPIYSMNCIQIRKLRLRAAVCLMSMATFLAAFYATPAFGNTTTVTNTADSGAGSLRAAIAAASPGDTINFSLTYPATITLASPLAISSNLTIKGPGASSLAISGNNSVQVFIVNGGYTATISGLTIENGATSSVGGGISNNGGTLTVSNSTFSSNSATNGGGGIFNGGGGTLTVSNSTFSSNSASDGGGIYNTGTLTVSNSTFSSNSATFGGGGILNFGTLTVSNSTFSSNSATVGGGGGIQNFQILTVSNSTFFSNSATNGGGISNSGGVIIKNTIFANNGSNCSGPGQFTSEGHNLSDDLSCSASFTNTGAGDLKGIPAGLDPSGLKNNGGPTQTIAILITSPAFNAIPLSPTNYCTAIDGVTPIAADQRGTSRPQVTACDIGAFELSIDDDATLAQLNGGNTFTGNQAINGNLAATNLVAGGVTTQSLNCSGCIGAGQLGVNWAAGDVAGGNALNALNANSANNALMLGGLSPASYATTGKNLFVGDQIITGMLSATNVVLPSTGTATSIQGFNSNAFDTVASVFNSTAGAAQNQLFRWQVEPAAGTNNTANPSATLNLLFGSSGAPGETGLSVNANGTINFAAGQSFPSGASGLGTITGVSAGTGLTGGGTGGNVTLNNTGILALTAGTGITSSGGQSPTLTLNTSFTDARYLLLSGGTLSGGLNAPSFAGSGSGLTNLNPSNLLAGTAGINITGNAATATSAVNALTATNAGNAANLGGIAAVNYARLDIPNSFTGTQTVNGNQVVNGTQTVNGNVSATGKLSIGGGTPIAEYISTRVTTTLSALTSQSCTTFATAPLTGFTTGSNDTIALGIPSALASAFALTFQAWETTSGTSPTVTIRVCNFTGARYGGSGATSYTIGLDIFKH